MKSLPEHIKFRELPDFFKEHLSVYPTSNIKFIIASLTFVPLDIVIIVPLLVPIVESVLMVTIPLLVFINAWALRLLIKKPQETELESILYLGMLGVVGSICYFVLVQKMAYMNLKADSPMYAIISALAFILFFYSQIKYQKNKYSFKEGQQKHVEPDSKLSTPNKVVLAAPAVGYIFAHFIMGFSDLVLASVMIIVYLVISMVFIYIAAKLLHKYTFIKKHPHLVTLSKSNKSTKKGMV